MKLYPKQLNSLEDLKREKHALKLAINRSEPLINFDDFTSGNAQTSQILNEGLINKIIAALDSKSILNSLIDIVPLLLPALSNKTGFTKKAIGVIENIAKEVVSGYVSWKAIKYGYKAVKFLFKSKKKKAQA